MPTAQQVEVNFVIFVCIDSSGSDVQKSSIKSRLIPESWRQCLSIIQWSRWSHIAAISSTSKACNCQSLCIKMKVAQFFKNRLGPSEYFLSPLKIPYLNSNRCTLMILALNVSFHCKRQFCRPKFKLFPWNIPPPMLKPWVKTHYRVVQKNSCILEFFLLTAANWPRQAIHSPSALTELPLPNLAGTFLLYPIHLKVNFQGIRTLQPWQQDCDVEWQVKQKINLQVLRSCALKNICAIKGLPRKVIVHWHQTRVGNSHYHCFPEKIY